MKHITAHDRIEEHYKLTLMAQVEDYDNKCNWSHLGKRLIPATTFRMEIFCFRTENTEDEQTFAWVASPNYRIEIYQRRYSATLGCYSKIRYCRYNVLLCIFNSVCCSHTSLYKMRRIRFPTFLQLYNSTTVLVLHLHLARLYVLCQRATDKMRLGPPSI